MANRTDPAAKSIRETNYQKLVDKGMELETHPHKDIFVEFIKNQDYKWTLESIGSLDLRKSALEDDFEEEEEKDEEDELNADLDAGAHERDFITVDEVPQRKEIGIENATVTGTGTGTVVGMQGSSKLCYSTFTVDSDNDNDGKNKESEDYDDDFLAEKPELQPQSVDPRRGWGFRGVHKAIICGKVGQAPVQKILRNGRTVTIFTVGTGGMFDQRIVGAKDLPKPAQWHRIAVHNEPLGAYAVQQLIKNSSVYVEGDIETRVYNDSINGEVKHVPEICVRRDGKIRLVKTGESTSNICFDELREGLLA